MVAWPHRLCVAALSLLAGSACSFRVDPAACLDGCEIGDAPPADTPLIPPPPTDGAPDAPPAPFCDPAGGNLIACFELEGNAQDGSPNHLDGTTTNITFVAGQTGMAARDNGTSTFDVAENPLLDPIAITIEAWIRPSQLPPNNARAGIVDNDQQWGFFLHPAGDLQCIGLQVPAKVKTGKWTHVACTYDGTTRIYADGVQIGMTAGGGAKLTAAGTTGTTIAGDNPSGSRLVGDIDQVRIFKIARTAAQICASASTCL